MCSYVGFFFRDTPVGTLHFLYLGLAKHLIKVNVFSIMGGKIEEDDCDRSFLNSRGQKGLILN